MINASCDVVIIIKRLQRWSAAHDDVQAGRISSSVSPFDSFDQPLAASPVSLNRATLLPQQGIKALRIGIAGLVYRSNTVFFF